MRPARTLWAAALSAMILAHPALAGAGGEGPLSWSEGTLRVAGGAPLAKKRRIAAWDSRLVIIFSHKMDVWQHLSIKGALVRRARIRPRGRETKLELEVRGPSERLLGHLKLQTEGEDLLIRLRHPAAQASGLDGSPLIPTPAARPASAPAPETETKLVPVPKPKPKPKPGPDTKPTQEKPAVKPAPEKPARGAKAAGPAAGASEGSGAGKAAPGLGARALSPASSPSLSSRGPSMTPFWLLMVVITAAAGLAWWLRRRRAAAMPGTHVALVSSTPLTGKARLVLTEVCDELLLLGVTESAVQLLRVIHRPSLEARGEDAFFREGMEMDAANQREGDLDEWTATEQAPQGEDMYDTHRQRISRHLQRQQASREAAEASEPAPPDPEPEASPDTAEDPGLDAEWARRILALRREKEDRISRQG